MPKKVIRKKKVKVEELKAIEEPKVEEKKTEVVAEFPADLETSHGVRPDTECKCGHAYKLHNKRGCNSQGCLCPEFDI